MKHLSFPFINTCDLQLKTKVAEKVITCELAESVIEIFQSLNFRKAKGFTTPLVLKIENANIQSFVLTNYFFSVEHICIEEHSIVDKTYTQFVSKTTAPFVQSFSGFKLIVLAPVGFIKKYKIKEKETIISLINKQNNG
jgi:hypothetical protein